MLLRPLTSFEAIVRPVTIKTLRKDLPMWSWTAHRRGFGDWYYVGELAFSRVEVRAYAQLCGPSDDDFATIWRVSEGEHSESFATFWLRWAGDGPQTDRERREVLEGKRR